MSKTEEIKTKKNIAHPISKIKQHAIPVNPEIAGWKKTTALFILLLLTFIAYTPALKNDFINKWDDNVYITDNPSLQLSIANIEASFLHGERHGMYLPLTSLTFSLNNYFGGMNPFYYHLVNILIHLLIVALVFLFISMLFQSFEVALITAGLFALHSMQVESVAFAAGRRDLLYTLFFVISCFFYLKFLDTAKWKFYTHTMLFFILSLFSKGQAVSLPLTLIILDYFRQKKILTRRSVLEKIPFFALSLIFGIIAYRVKSGTVYAVTVESLPFYIRAVLACFGFTIYLVKLIIPFNLSVIYPYPVKPGHALLPEYYIYPLIVTIFLFLLYYLFRKGYRVITFGVLFFALNIFLVLQLAPNSYGIVNEHYVYLPSIGIFMLSGAGLQWIREHRRSLLYASISVFLLYLLFLGVSTYARCKVWQNSISIYSDVISKYPDDALAYNNRGSAYYEQKNYELALRDFDDAIRVNSFDPGPYNNRGSIYFYYKRYEEAVKDYDMAIKLKPGYLAAYSNRGNVYSDMHKYDEALKDYDEVLKTQPENAKLLLSHGNVNFDAGRFADAIRDFDKAAKIKPGYVEAYYNLGNAHYRLQKYDEAVKDYAKAIELKPDYAEAYINTGNIYDDQHQCENALRVYDMAVKVRPGFAKALYNRGNCYSNLGKFDKAIADFNAAIRSDSTYALAYYNRGNNYFTLHRNQEAIKDWEKAIRLSPDHEPMLREMIRKAGGK